MSQTASSLSFEDYLNLDGEGWLRLGLPEGRCEYGNGELSELPSESELNDFIANLLMFTLASRGLVPLRLIRPGKCEIEVPGKPRTRYPDLVILREEHLALTQKRLLITQQMAPPVLVAEVVSPGDENRRRDYELKRFQYQQRGIPEYWLINPEQQIVTVLVLEEGEYVELGSFRGAVAIVSPAIPNLALTANEIFAVT